MVTLPGTRPPTEGGALAVGDKVVLAKGVVEEEAAGLPRRFAEARCCCRRRWSGVITCDCGSQWNEKRLTFIGFVGLATYLKTDRTCDTNGSNLVPAFCLGIWARDISIQTNLLFRHCNFQKKFLNVTCDVLAHDR